MSFAEIGSGWDDLPPQPKPLTMKERLQRMAAVPAAAPATKVHAILVGDTEDEDLGEGAMVDLKRVRDLLVTSLTARECAPPTEIKGRGR
jgi:hypothetical protein